MNIHRALHNGYGLLKSKKIDSYKIDTELLLSDSLNISRERLILNFNKIIGVENYENFLSKLDRRQKKEPVAYIVNKKEFWKNRPARTSKLLLSGLQELSERFLRSYFVHYLKSSLKDSRMRLA